MIGLVHIDSYDTLIAVAVYMPVCNRLVVCAIEMDIKRRRRWE